jgi:hypothetical protein
MEFARDWAMVMNTRGVNTPWPADTSISMTWLTGHQSVMLSLMDIPCQRFLRSHRSDPQLGPVSRNILFYLNSFPETPV